MQDYVKNVVGATRYLGFARPLLPLRERDKESEHNTLQNSIYDNGIFPNAH